MPIITNIEDLRVLHQKRTPKMFYDYADSGSWTESTYRANESDFQKIKLRLGKSLLRDLVNSTIGFEGLAQEMNKPSKSLHRMLAPSGNPTMENFFQVIHVIQKNEGINFQLNVLAKKKARVSQKVYA